jgi:hypothetical protein
MAMEKYGTLRRHAPDGRRLPDYIDVGYDAATDTLWNPRNYPQTDLRRAIADFRARLDERYAEKAEKPNRRRDFWNDRR